MSDAEELTEFTVSGADDEIDLLPVTPRNVCGCAFAALRRVLPWIAVALASVVGVVLLSVCNVYLMMKPLTRLIHGDTTNRSGVTCGDSPSGDAATLHCFLISLAVDFGEITVCFLLWLLVRCFWLQYSADRQRELRRTVKNE